MHLKIHNLEKRNAGVASKWLRSLYNATPHHHRSGHCTMPTPPPPPPPPLRSLYNAPTPPPPHHHRSGHCTMPQPPTTTAQAIALLLD